MGLFGRRPTPQRALTAASNAPSGTIAVRTGTGQGVMAGMMSQAWQVAAWGYFDTTGPLTFAAIYRGNMFRQMRLYAAVRPDDNPDGDPIPVEDILDPEKEATAPDGVPTDLVIQAQIELARIRDPISGQSGLLFDFGVNLTVAGDSRLVVEPDPTEVNGERWQVYSVTELVHAGKWPDGTPRWTAVGPPSRILAPGTIAYRLYSPHPNRHSMAHSCVLGVLNDLEEYHLIQRSFRGVAKSRISGAGVLTIPNELDFPSSDPDDPDAPTQLMVDMVRHMSTPLNDEGDASNLVPHFLRGPAEFLDSKYLHHIPFVRPADAVMDTREDKKLRALAIGLDTPPEILLGIGDVSHWGAWQVSESSWKQHGEPGMIQIVGQLGALPLRSLLTAAAREDAAGNALSTPRWTPAQIAQIVVGYDPTNLLDHPDRSKDALNLYQEFELSGDSLRDASNFSDEDKPNADEVAARIERQRLIHSRGAPVEFIDPRYTSAPGENPKGPAEPNIPLTPVGQAPPPGGPAAPVGAPTPSLANTPAGATKGPPARTAAVMAPAARQSRPVGHKLADLDLALYSRVHGLAQAAVRRQLEKAGIRITGKTQRDKPTLAYAKAQPKHMVAAALGRQVVAALGFTDNELVGDYTDLLDEVDTHVAKTRAAGLVALLAYAKAHGQTLSDAQITEYQAQAGRQQADGRTQLGAALTGFTTGLLYQPDPAADVQGEGVAAGDIPPGLVRGALAVYGGQQLGADGRPADGTPLLSVAAGALNLTTGSQLGMQTGLWQWVHGDPERPFPPHEALDGVIIDDGDATNTARENVDSPWLDTTDYFPGDHDGCTCYADYLVSYDVADGGDGS